MGAQSKFGSSAARFVDGVLSHLGVQASVTTGAPREDAVVVKIAGAESLDRRVELVSAIGLLASQVCNKEGGEQRRCILDLGGDLDRREGLLKGLAHDVAEAAARTGRRVVLEQLSSADRRVVHTALQDDGRVVTRSEGADERRVMLIEPARRA